MGQASEPFSRNAVAPVSWLLQRRGFLLICAIAAVVGFLAGISAGLQMEFIIAFDFAAFAYVALFVTLMNVANEQHAAEWSSRAEPSGVLMLTGVIILSIVSIVAVGALHQPAADAQKILYLTASLTAICLAWLIVHIRFGLFYMTMYYDDTIDDSVTAYDEGMEMPGRKTPDYWDFMYYSFTIAMCYQTSDVTIRGTKVRRVTLLHAIFSFIYVVAILGLVINVVGNVI